jgi:hypothetical protein
MKKESKIILSVISILLIVGILVLVLYSTGNLQSVTGFSTLSLSPTVQFNSNDATVNGQAWLLSVSQNGAGQSASGTFTARDTTKNAYSNQFTVTLNLDKNYATYPIYSQSTQIRRLSYTTTTYNPLASMGGCDSKVWTNYYHPSQFAVLGTVYCYKYSTDAVLGTIGSGNTNFQSTISVEGSGGSESCVVSNNAQTSCVTSDGKVQASWGGSLVSGQSIPQPTDQKLIALYKTSSNGWVTGSELDYNNWKSKFDSINSCLEQYKSTSCFTEANNAEATLLGGKPFTTTGGITATSTGSQTNGQLIMQLPTQTQFPVIIMRIKADVIGINIPVGKPKITSTSSTTFQTGNTGTIKVTVRNDGTGVGSFDISSSCTNGFYQTGNSLRISSLAVGSSQTVYLPITSNVVSGTLAGTCQVIATDVNNPTNKDTSSVSVSSKAISICTESDYRISGNNIEQCKNNIWVLVKSCPSNQVAEYVGTTPQCVDIQTNGSLTSSNGCSKWFGLFTSPICLINNLVTPIRLVLSIGIGLLVGVLVMLSFVKIFEKAKVNMSSQSIWITSIIIGILLGIAFGILAYLYFWYGVLALVIFIIIKVFL